MPDPIIRAANAREKARQEKNQWKARARKAERQLQAVRELHQEHGCGSDRLYCSIIVTGECSRVGTCEHCRHPSPCPTIQAIEGDQ